MVKPKSASAKGQKTITSFFGGGGSSKPKTSKSTAKPKKQPEAIDVEENDDDEPADDAGSDYVQDGSEEDVDDVADEEVVSEVEENASDVEMEEEEKPAKGKGKGKAKAAPKGDRPKMDTELADLPPLYEIPAIFHDLVGRIPAMKGVAEQLQGRKMRVATMCSGTESPLLALDLIARSIKDHHGLDFEIEHVFSCEIEPFKQAYIERNFSPPLLFRDVCELGNSHAHTAYGSLAPVPGDVDLLVAGTSCVDYSNLNNEKQDIDGQGESGRTFRGMLDWVKMHRPPLVILENVCSAPWDKVVNYFATAGYSAAWTRVDTKHYYIPHTRTRVYLLAIDSKRSDIPTKWKEMLPQYRRFASSPLDAFLLPSDDPRIHHARERLVKESFNGLDRRTGRMDWGRCESRHQRARLEEELGNKRPLTNWEDGGFCKLPDFAWNDWGIGQVERVWDLMDISLLRAAQKGMDPSYRTLVWNLSQNVDRTIGSGKTGICPCLTPSMIPYITNRGGPMVGLEALSMQGLPVDELLLTRESEDQLADLAGNAMSTTVVGTCIMLALVVGKKFLKAGDDKDTYEKKKDLEEAAPEVDDLQDVVMDIKKLGIRTESSLDDHISGEDQLVERPLDLAASGGRSLADLLVDAHKSARLCECEGRKDMTSRELKRCLDCGSSSCVKCGGRPEHNLETIDVVAEPRLSPSGFERELKSTLPMALLLPNVTQDLLNEVRDKSGAEIPASRWKKWSEAVIRAAADELHFAEPRRQEIWTVIYQSPFSRLELLLHPQQPEWRFYAHPDADESAKSDIRALLEAPVGRFICKGGLFEGHWEFALPCEQTFKLTIEGQDPVPSWEAKLGLQGAAYKDKMVHSRLDITVSEDDVSKLERDISGTYILYDKCGTACSSLHKRVTKAEDKDLPPIFFFLDPNRNGKAEEDCFIFSISRRRYEYGENRPVILTANSSWRQSDVEGEQSVKCKTPCKWAKSSVVRITPAPNRNAVSAIPDSTLDIKLSGDSCRSANAVLTCHIPLHGQAGSEWPIGKWGEVDKVHERRTFKALAWLTERVRNDNTFADWQEVDMGGSQDDCERCAPKPPSIKWARNDKRKIVAIEDTTQAGAYERALKSRPQPFVTQLKVDKDGIGYVRIGINVTSLIHRALSRLPTAGRTERATVAWRLNSDFTPIAKLNLSKFALLSNKRDVEHTQPPSFKLPLRPEQLRSLTWMIKQEALDAPPFIEEEISEAILEPLSWRVEGRAQRPNRVRGGVLADEVGYGKTAITLGLIDCASKDVQREYSKLDDDAFPGKIPVKATLVVVPPHLTGQWESECRKFAGKRFKVVNLTTAANLNSVTIEDIKEADIVIVASNIFRSAVYIENLGDFSASGGLPEKQEGRYFNARLDVTLKALQKQVNLLQKAKGSEKVLSKIREAAKKGNDEDNLALQSKRLKGKSYRDKAMAQEDTKKEPTKKEAVAQSPKAAARNGKIMEVVIPARSKALDSSAPSSPTTSFKDATTADEDSDIPTSRPSRLKRKLVLPSDDEDEEPAPVKRSTKGKGKKQESSDYEGSDEGQTTDGMDIDTMAESDDEKPKKKYIAKAKAKKPVKGRSKAMATSDSEVTDGMDIDEPLTSKAKGKGKASKATKKRRTSDSSDIEDEDTKRPAKKPRKARRAETDPWKLGSAAIKKDWEQMKAPPLEMFHFARKVVDEYTYLEGRALAMITSLTADRHWVLSGTPPTSDFGALKTISGFLNIHLGVDDDGEGDSAKKRKREQTDVEKFHSFREVHSLEWHAHRHELGQRFLNQFVRQNIAEIDEIPCTHKVEKITLPAAERAIYLELEHHLRALDMTVKRGKKSESDREKRLAQALGDSASAEEALLKRCSHFDLETKEDNALKACEIIVNGREKQLENCKDELLGKLKQAVKQEKEIGDKAPDESLFQEYARVSRAEGVGDKDATAIILQLLEKANVPVVKKPKGKSDAKDLSEKLKAQVWDLRELTHEIRRITKELVGRVRSLRYFRVVRDLQRQAETRDAVSCPACGKEDLPIDDIAVLSSCGHMGCVNCVKTYAADERCVYASQGACNAAARELNIVKGDTLGVDDTRNGKGKHYGAKLESIIDLIKRRLPKDERVLIFVQFPDLMKKVAEALEAHKIKFLEIKGSASVKSNNLLKYQNDSSERVLLLNVMDESASGANLTVANHAIFLSPLLAQSQEQYVSCETQAIGRVRRYGQNKHVNIWRFLSLNTIDVTIYEDRTHTKLV